MTRALTQRLRFLRWRFRRWIRELRDGFDRRFGTETASYVPVAELGIDGTAADAAEAYAPCPVPWAQHMLSQLPIDPCEFVFVDLGSGKGRVLLVASSFPYRRIVGVELSPRLHTIAKRNVARWRSTEQRCFAIEPQLGDAGEFVPPDENTVVFLFNPFGPATLARVLARFQASARAQPREFLILYAWPEHADLFDRPGVSRIGGGANWHLYRITDAS